MNVSESTTATLPSRFSLIITVMLLVMLMAMPVQVTGAEFALSDGPVVIAKESPVFSGIARAFLVAKGTANVKVWVNFTDKGMSEKNGFRRAASSVSLTERAMRRRAKMGLDKVLFVDIPVLQNYVDAIILLGATHRRSSRWLNAASFELPLELIDAVAELPYVASIRPMAGFKSGSKVELGSAPRQSQIPEALGTNMLNYGNSATQLNQINVPAAHSRGLTGNGVTLAIMDTGFRKSHEAFAAHFADGRVLAEYDFVFNDGNTANEAGDVASQWSHGTLIWSVSGGSMDGQIYGPAYGANFILCKTEDLRSETPVEEDNWVAAMEFSDSVGTDVITTSLGYSDWYTFSDFDGQTAVITIGANTATALGIVMCNSMGNSGPANGTLTAPADAFEILSVGAVNSLGTIASFSSRGPTFDGRPKPEVVAMGVSAFCASSSSDNFYTTASGTSFSAPLVAGAACLVLEANPFFTPQEVRQALMQTASQAANPDSTTYGFGIIDADAASQPVVPPNCCLGSTGNIDADLDDVTDIGDLTFLIDHLFINFPPLVCAEEGNVDGDPDGIIDISDLTFLIDHLFINFVPTAACM